MERPMISQDLWRHQPMKWKVLPPLWESVRDSSDASDDISVPWIMLSKIQITSYLIQNLPQPQQRVQSGVTGATILAGFMPPSSFDNPKGKLGKLAL